MLLGLHELAHAMLSTTLELSQGCFLGPHTEISAYAHILRMSFIDDGKYKMLCSTLLSAHFVPYSLNKKKKE